MSEIQNDTSLEKGSGFGIASFVLGILCMIILGFIPALVGIVLGMWSLKTEGRGFGIAGLILCIIAFPMRVIQTLVIHGML